MVKWKKWWIWIVGAVLLIFIIAVIIGRGNDKENESIPASPTNIYLISGNVQTTSEEIGDYGFYTSSGQIALSFSRLAGFSGELTIKGEELEKTVSLNDEFIGYVFTELDTATPYTFLWEGDNSCDITVSEMVSGSELTLDETMQIDLNPTKFTTNSEDIGKYSFHTDSSKIYVTINGADSFEGKIVLWSTMNGGDHIRSTRVDENSNICEFTKLRSSTRYQISCEDLDGCEIVLSAK